MSTKQNKNKETKIVVRTMTIAPPAAPSSTLGLDAYRVYADLYKAYCGVVEKTAVQQSPEGAIPVAPKTQTPVTPGTGTKAVKPKPKGSKKQTVNADTASSKKQAKANLINAKAGLLRAQASQILTSRREEPTNREREVPVGLLFPQDGYVLRSSTNPEPIRNPGNWTPGREVEREAPSVVSAPSVYSDESSQPGTGTSTPKTTGGSKLPPMFGSWGEVMARGEPPRRPSPTPTAFSTRSIKSTRLLEIVNNPATSLQEKANQVRAVYASVLESGIGSPDSDDFEEAIGVTTDQST